MIDLFKRRKAWLESGEEPALDPDRPIIDTHHHIWNYPGMGPYFLDDLWADTSTGHNIVKTVFMDCTWSYRTEGPEHLKPVGETEFIRPIAEDSATRSGRGRPEIAGLIAHADLRLGTRLEETLDAHEEAGGGRFRGIRHYLARTPDTLDFNFPGMAPEDLAEDPEFRDGVRHLGARKLLYESWHFQNQNSDFTALARACPDTRMVFEQLASPIGADLDALQEDDLFDSWKAQIADMATCPNVVVKIGALLRPLTGYRWRLDKTPPATSDELLALHARYYRHTIECFGAERIMFGSNCPAEKNVLSYAVYWNTMKKLVSDFSEDEKNAMFYGTAARIYNI